VETPLCSKNMSLLSIEKIALGKKAAQAKGNCSSKSKENAAPL